jgi:hypothetical protein
MYRVRYFQLSTEQKGNVVKTPTLIKLTTSGVYLLKGGTKQRIAAPIRFHAIGKRLDGNKVVELRCVNCDGETISEQFDMSAINPKNLSTIDDALGN